MKQAYVAVKSLMMRVGSQCCHLGRGGKNFKFSENAITL